MRRRHLRRQFAGMKAVVRERWGVGVARPELDVLLEVVARHVVGCDQPGLTAELGGHVAEGHALLHREAADRRAAVFDRLVLAAVHAEPADQEQHHVLRGDARREDTVELHPDGVRHLEPDLAGHHGAQPLEHRLQAARAARVVHHRKVDLASHDLARRDVRAACGAGDELLGESLLHPCSRNSFSALYGGFTKLDRRLTAAMPAVSRSLIAISADLAMRVMPFTIGAPSMLAPRSAPNSIIGRPPAGTITSAPASSRMRHSRSHFGARFFFASSLANGSMKSATVACTARTTTTPLWMT